MSLTQKQTYNKYTMSVKYLKADEVEPRLYSYQNTNEIIL